MLLTCPCGHIRLCFLLVATSAPHDKGLQAVIMTSSLARVALLRLGGNRSKKQRSYSPSPLETPNETTSEVIIITNITLPPNHSYPIQTQPDSIYWGSFQIDVSIVYSNFTLFPLSIFLS